MPLFLLRHDATRSTLRGGDDLRGPQGTPVILSTATITQSATFNPTFAVLSATLTQSANFTTSGKSKNLFSISTPAFVLRSPVSREATLRTAVLRLPDSNPLGGITMSAFRLFAAIVRSATITQTAGTIATNVATTWYNGPIPFTDREYGTLFGNATPNRTYGQFGTPAPKTYFQTCSTTVTMSAESKILFQRLTATISMSVSPIHTEFSLAGRVLGQYWTHYFNSRTEVEYPNSHTMVEYSNSHTRTTKMDDEALVTEGV